MKVLVGIDESECSGAAIRFASETPWPMGTRFLVVSVSPPMFMGAGEVVAPDSLSEILAQEEARHRDIAEHAASRLRENGLIAEARTVRGNAQTILVDTARSQQVDLVIVGSHGSTGLKKLFLGSVASHVATHAPCSVLVVKQPQLRGPGPLGSGSESGKEGTMQVEKSVSACPLQENPVSVA
jgi:nucleotide-binding universal stress UspA family protein